LYDRSIEKDLHDLNIYNVSDLRNKYAQKLCKKLMQIRDCDIDRCMLYVFRCAIYFASTKNPDPELLKWWNRQINNPHFNLVFRPIV